MDAVAQANTMLAMANRKKIPLSKLVYAIQIETAQSPNLAIKIYKITIVFGRQIMRVRR